VRRGIGFVKESGDKALCRDCAAILEAMEQHSEAAALYELAELWEKAAAIYIRKLNFTQAAAIMPKVQLPKLHAQYGKACEQAGKFADAARAYEVARDMDAVVRLYLGHQLNQPEKAFEIVRATASSDGAQLVARFCQTHGDIRGAIEFLLMARQSDEAFDLAKAHSQVDVYAAALGEHMSPDDALQVAQYYEKEHDLGKAGKYHAARKAAPNVAGKPFSQKGKLWSDGEMDAGGRTALSFQVWR
jgi:WD repeat-containing protein 19